MRRIIFAMLTFLGLTLGIMASAAPASASAAHTSRPAAACSAEWTAEAFYAHAQGHWVTDCGTYGRIHIKCSNLTQHWYGSGGWVHRVNINDAKYCPSSMTLAKAAWQTWNGEPGFPVCTFWFWPTRSQHCSGGGTPAKQVSFYHGRPTGHQGVRSL